MIRKLLNGNGVGKDLPGIPLFGVLFLPILIEQLFVTFVSNVDTILLSKYSDEAVAAVGLSLPIIKIGTLFLFIVATGSTILLTQLSQKKDPKRESSIMVSGFLFNLFLGLALGIFFWLFGRKIMELMQAKELLEGSYSYLKIVGFSLIFQGGITALSAFLRAYGQVQVTMNVSIFVNVFNVLADALVVLTPFPFLGKGIVGVANATLFSRLLGLLVVAYAFYSFLLQRGLSFKLRDFYPKFVKEIFQYGAPSAFETISFLSSQAIITGFIAYLGTHSLSARVYTETLTSFIFSLSIALGMTGQIFIGRFLGQDKKEEAFTFSLYNRRGSLLLVFLSTCLLTLACPYILPKFTQDPKILELTFITMALSILHQPGRAANVTSISYLNAAGEVKYPLLVSLFITYLFTVPLSYLLAIPFQGGLISIYLVFILDEIIRSSLNWRKWKKKEWMDISVLD